MLFQLFFTRHSKITICSINELRETVKRLNIFIDVFAFFNYCLYVCGMKITQEDIKKAELNRLKYKQKSFWPQYGDQFIKDNYIEMNDIEMSMLLASTESATKQRRVKLQLFRKGLVRPKKYSTMAKKAAIYEAYIISSDKNELAKDTAKKFGVTYSMFSRIVNQIAPRSRDCQDFIVKQSKINDPE